MEAVAVALPQRKSAFEITVIVILGLVALDVVTLFVAGALNVPPVMKAALSVFVYIQVAMTGASLLSIPVTLLMRILLRGKGAKPA
jgi:hypothetical protein